jgi:hypothetical protein
VFRLLLQARELYRSPRGRSLTGLLCILLLLIATNVLAAFYLPQRFDVTEDRRYTLSRGTRETLARIDEPINLRFYYSPALGIAIPAYAVYAARVSVLLDQYVATAHGKLRLDVLDPKPLSPAEADAVGFGLTGVPLDGSGDEGYFGLVGTNSTDDRQVIALFDPAREPLLEFALTRLVRNLAYPNDAGGESDLALAALRHRATSARSLELVDRIRRRAAAGLDAEALRLQRRIADLQGQPRDRRGARAAGRLRLELLAARRRLRAVEAAQRQPVERLETIVEVADLAPMPILVGAVSLSLARRRGRRSRHPA